MRFEENPPVSFSFLLFYASPTSFTSHPISSKAVRVSLKVIRMHNKAE